MRVGPLRRAHSSWPTRNRGRSGRQRHEPAELYQALRKHVLESVPDNLPEKPREAPILALLWENGFTEAVGTLLGSVDGHGAMYLSNGGGTWAIGLRRP